MKQKIRIVVAAALSMAMFATGVFAFASPAAAIDEDSDIVRIENADLGGVLIASAGNSPLSITSGDNSEDIETLWEVIDLGLGTIALQNVGTGRYLKTRSGDGIPRYSVLTSRANVGLHASYQWNLEPVIDSDNSTLRNVRTNRYLDADTPAAGPRVDLHAMTVRGTAWNLVEVNLSELDPVYTGPTSFQFVNTFDVEIDFGALFDDPLGQGLTFSLGGPLEASLNETATIDPNTGVFTATLDAFGFYDPVIIASNDAGDTSVYIGGGIFTVFD